MHNGPILNCSAVHFYHRFVYHTGIMKRLYKNMYMSFSIPHCAPAPFR